MSPDDRKDGANSGLPSDSRAHLGGPSPLLYFAGSFLSVVVLQDDRLVAILLSAFTLLLGLRIFYWHGDRLLTAAGLYSLMSAIMVGGGGLWWTLVEENQPEYLSLSLGVGFFTLWSMYSLFWRQFERGLTPPAASRRIGLWLITIGGIVSVLALGAAREGVPLGSVLAMGALSLLILGTSWSSVKFPLFIRAVLVLAPVAVFAFAVFDGYGRLQIVAMAIFAAATFRTEHGRKLKAAIVAVAPIAILQFSAMREQFGVERFGEELNGIGSVVNPVVSFARLVDANGMGGFEFGEGRPFVATLLFWVPRSMWEGKPLGFGSQLSTVLDPELAAIGHSESALAYGEWYYNLGPVGIILMIPVVGLAIKCIDAVWLKANSKTLESVSLLISYVAAAVVVSGVLYYFWSSSYTFATRVVPQIVLVSLSVVVLGLLTGPRETQESLSAPCGPRR